MQDKLAKLKIIDPAIILNNDMMDAILYRAMPDRKPVMALRTTNEFGYQVPVAIAADKGDATAHWPKWKKQLLGKQDGFFQFDTDLLRKAIGRKVNQRGMYDQLRNQRVVINRGDHMDFLPMAGIQVGDIANWPKINIADVYGIEPMMWAKDLKFHLPRWDREELAGPHWRPDLLMNDHPRYNARYFEYGPNRNHFKPWLRPGLKNEHMTALPAKVDGKHIVYRLEKDGFGPARHPVDGFHMQRNPRIMNAYGAHNYKLPERLGDMERGDEVIKWFGEARSKYDDIRYACPSIETLIFYWTEEFFQVLLQEGFTVQCYEVDDCLPCPNGWQLAYSNESVRDYAKAA